MNEQLRKEIKEEIKKILADFNVSTMQEWMGDELDSGLFETLKGAIVEEYELTDDEMSELLDEIFGA
ncbi:MAG: hypothetical protein J6J86_00380 [Lachnospiraceae bacterium]|nr:hypothetical protein [Lachnospiraceae bacterium]